MRPTLQRMHDEIERFMTWDTEDHSQVTTTSAAMFAEQMVDNALSAGWISQIHILCNDLHIKPGHICNRTADAVAKLAQIKHLLKQALPHVQSSAQAEHLTDGFRPRHHPYDDLVKAMEEVLK